jgi:eukaryotic-like serine/threonine-protein kinase
MSADSDRWEQVEDLYLAVAQLRLDEHAAFLDEHCGSDKLLRRDIESLLAYHTSAEPFIEMPAFEQTAISIAREGLPDWLVGKTAANFRVIERLGAGGMGVVYKAEDTNLGRMVALKFLPPHFAHDASSLERLKREARSASALNHPNVCTVYQIAEYEGRPFIAMELLEGNTLDREIENRSLTVEKTLALALQLADALVAAHTLGIVHRDIKPSNLLLTSRGVLKVLDFGIAKVTQTVDAAATNDLAKTDITIAGPVFGTAAYMSPEQVRGEPLDGRSDLFSVGAVIYEMLTRERAFAGETPAVIFEAILNRPPQPIRAANRDVPEELERIVGRCLAKETDGRYQHASELQADIAAAIRAAPAAGSSGQNGSKPKTMQAKVWRYAQPRAALVSLGIVLAGLLAVGTFFGRRPPRAGPHTPVSTMAVLPFKPLVPNSRDEALELGMADTLITNLSTSRRIIVRPISSVRKYAGLEQDPLAAGRDLGVQAVLDGTIEKVGDRVRVTARLWSVEDNSSLWSGQFDARFTNIFSVQDSISQRVAVELAPALSRDEREVLAKRYTENAEAYELYLKGRFFWNKRTPDATRRAADYFQQALNRDPTYALAFAGLAECYRTLPITGDEPARIAFPKAKQAALRALELDDSLAEAHTSLGFIKLFYDWDWDGSEKEHRRALQINPNNSMAHLGYAHLLSNIGRHEEALTEAEHAVRLDPVSPYVGALNGLFLFQAHRYSESVVSLRKTLEIDPNFWIAQLTIGKNYDHEGRYGDALVAFAKAQEFSGGTTEPISARGYTYAVAGRVKEAQQALVELRATAEQRYVPPYNFALVYEGLGNSDESLRWLERAYEERDVHMIFLAVDPRWDKLRNDPRFVHLLARLNLQK